MAKKLKEIFDDYNRYSDDVTLKSSVLQGVLSSGKFLNEQKLAKDLIVDKTQKLTSGTIGLNTFDIRPGATRNLDKSFNTMLKMSREGGQDIDPSLLSRYSDAASEIEGKQAAMSTETRNKERMINFESAEKTKAINAQIEAADNRMEYENRLRKTQMSADSLNQFNIGMANISDMNSRNIANKFNADLLRLSLTPKPGFKKEEVKREPISTAISGGVMGPPEDPITLINRARDKKKDFELSQLDTSLGGGGYELPRVIKPVEFEEEGYIDDIPLNMIGQGINKETHTSYIVDRDNDNPYGVNAIRGTEEERNFPLNNISAFDKRHKKALRPTLSEIERKKELRLRKADSLNQQELELLERKRDSLSAELQKRWDELNEIRKNK